VRVGVIAVPGAFDSALTSVLDVLGVAEELRETVDPEIPEIENVICGVGQTAVTQRGLTVPIEHHLLESGVDGFDLLVVPALGVFDSSEIGPVLARPAARKVRDLLAELGPDDRPGLAGACTGTFLLAEAGCLDDRRATTSWWLSAFFARRYPRVTLDMTRMVVDSGTIMTAGAAFAHIDLAISIVSRISARLAQLVAARLLIDERPARSVAAALGHLARSDELISDLENWIRVHLVRQIRVERANHLRRTTEQSMEQIARAVGYLSAATLSRLLRERT